MSEPTKKEIIESANKLFSLLKDFNTDAFCDDGKLAIKDLAQKTGFDLNKVVKPIEHRIYPEPINVEMSPFIGNRDIAVKVSVINNGKEIYTETQRDLDIEEY